MGRLIIILLLIATPCFGATSARLDSLRVKAFRQLDIPDAGTQKITSAIGNDAINLAISWICSNAPAIEKWDTVYITQDASGRALNSDFNRASTAEMIWSDTTSVGVYQTVRIPLLYLSEDSLRSRYRTLEEILPVDAKNPLSWKEFRTFGGRFLVWPIWNREDSMMAVVTYYANDTLLQANGSQTSVRPKFLEAVIKYAAYQLAMIRNNLDDATVFYNAARAYIGMPPVTKEELQEK